MKHIKTKDLAQILRKRGYNVTLKKRSDGGYLITSINGEKFKGAKGNNRARELTGYTLSEKMKTQRIGAKTKREEYSRSIDDEIKEELKKTRRLWKKRNKSWLNKSSHARITPKQIAKIYQRTGDKERVLRMLKQAQQYIEGWAYEENVRDLIERIIRLSNERRIKHQKDWIDIANYLNKNIDHIDVNLELNPMYEILYDYQEGTIPELQAVSSMKRILHF